MNKEEMMKALADIYYKASIILEAAPDEVDCGYAENELYAELANYVNAYPDFLSEVG